MLEKRLLQGIRADLESGATPTKQKNCTAADRKGNKLKSPFGNSSVVTRLEDDN